MKDTKSEEQIKAERKLHIFRNIEDVWRRNDNIEYSLSLYLLNGDILQIEIPEYKGEMLPEDWVKCPEMREIYDYINSGMVGNYTVWMNINKTWRRYICGYEPKPETLTF